MFFRPLQGARPPSASLQASLSGTTPPPAPRSRAPEEAPTPQGFRGEGRQGLRGPRQALSST